MPVSIDGRGIDLDCGGEIRDGMAVIVFRRKCLTAVQVGAILRDQFRPAPSTRRRVP